LTSVESHQATFEGTLAENAAITNATMDGDLPLSMAVEVPGSGLAWPAKFVELSGKTVSLEMEVSVSTRSTFQTVSPVRLITRNFDREPELRDIPSSELQEVTKGAI